MPILALLIFILILSILVIIHELGHFLVAKRAGIVVEEFGFGIPPRIFGKKFGETIYSINLFPFGGFVKVLGEDAEEGEKPSKNSFAAKSPLIRLFVLTAGVVMNVLFGSLLFFIVLSARGFISSPLMMVDTDAYKFPFGKSVTIDTVITFVAKDSPAASAGFSFGDYIVSAGFKDSKETTISKVATLQEYVATKDKESVKFLVGNLQTGKTREITATPLYNESLERSAIGVGLGSAVYLKYSGIEKPFSGLLHGINTTLYSISVFGNLIKSSAKEKSLEPVSSGFSGPVGIFGVVEGVINMGGDQVVLTLIEITALLSFSLAIFNILPIPALDGGRAAFVVYEIVFRKRPNQRLQSLSHSVGLVLLLSLMLVITLKDIVKPN